jgi:putative ABC transport system permease protein
MINGSADALNQPKTVLLSESTAKKFFGTTDVIGQTIFRGKQADNNAWTIGGVYKDYPENSQIRNWVMMPKEADTDKGNWKNWNYICYMRLESPSAAPEIEKLILQIFVKNFPELEQESDISQFIRLTPLVDAHFSTVGNKSASSRTTLYLLICVSFLIVIIATINFMNFSLAETPMRIKSINTQKVLGATTRSLRLTLITEAMLISFIAFILALIWVAILKDFGLQELVNAQLTITEHPMLLLATFCLSLLMGLMAGLYPSYYVTSFPPALVLKGSFGLSPQGRILRTVLVCIQFFVAYMLIIGVGIMYLQSRYIRTSDYGYDKDAIIVGNMTKETQSQTDAVVGELSQIPGVKGVAVSEFILSSADNYMHWGRSNGDKYIQFDAFPVDCRYLDVMGIHIVEGRSFKPGDEDVYIFNEFTRKKYPWLKVDQPAPDDNLVIGFCENIKYSSFRNDDTNQTMAFLIPGKKFAQWGWEWRNFVNVRISAGVDKVEVIRSLQKTMEKFTPGHDFNFRFMDEVLDANYRNELRFTKQILLFSLIAIAISLTGVFGLTMFESEYRRKEIGIRKIMGSSTRQILYMFNRRYILILTGCFIVAAPFGWWIGQHWLQGFAEKTPVTPWIFILSFLLVTLITMTTITVQSWKNANENPVNSIKTE